ncbi:MAG: hypothetical protein A2X82_06975 [Geobacteraceae bacterium GWC2_55_20]|nr:MAG: hypothetical protein A2X82_06975 [Geobacteraceae bacterium GWC2_55_20]
MLLQRRGKTYYLRVRVPADLKDIMDRAEVKQSLNVQSHKEAKALARLKGAELERAYLHLRMGRETMNDNQLKRMADKLLSEVLNKTERSRQQGIEALELSPDQWPEGYDYGDSSAGLRALEATLARQRTTEGLDEALHSLRGRIEELRQELRLGTYGEHTRRVARRIAESEGVVLPPASWFLQPGQSVLAADIEQGVPLKWLHPPGQAPKGLKKFHLDSVVLESTWNERPPAEFAVVLRTVAMTLLEGYEVELERVNGNYGTDRQLKADARLQQAAKSYTLNDVWGSYRDRKTTDGEWAESTLSKYSDFVTAVNKTLGNDYDFSIFEDVDQVTALIKQLRVYSSARTKKKWSTATINDCIVFLSTLHKDAIRNRKYGITFNPFEARRIAETDTKTKVAFTTDELRKIWAALQMLKSGDSDKYWAVLMMLYTGCRVGEVCQLRLDDFEKVGEHWVVHFRSRPELGQSIKGERRKKKKRPTEDVDRVTPVHPELRKLGIFRYIEQLKEAGEVKLFPNEKRTAGRSGVLMAKKIKTFLNGCIGDKSSHHFRHTMIGWFKQNCNLTHTEASLISAMVGHEDDIITGGNKITWGTYGGAHTVKQMYELIKRLDYEYK